MNTQNVDTPPAESQDGAKRKKHKKDKMRSAWISFAGRIFAQIVGAVATVVLAVTVLHQYKGEASSYRPASIRSVAVLPIENFSEDAGRDHVADSMTEMLIASLAKVPGLRVASRTSSMHFKGQHKALRDIATELEARWIVEGSIVQSGDRLRITAQLIDAGSDYHAWAETYDRSTVDLLAVQTEVAGAITRAVSAVLPGLE